MLVKASQKDAFFISQKPKCYKTFYCKVLLNIIVIEINPILTIELGLKNI